MNLNNWVIWKKKQLAMKFSEFLKDQSNNLQLTIYINYFLHITLIILENTVVKLITKVYNMSLNKRRNKKVKN